MEQHFVRIRSLNKVTHDVLRIQTERPSGYSFTPGQATEVAINKTGWQEERRPFTFTCLPDDDHLEFTIKTYPPHNSVTNELLKLKVDDELILHEVFGTIAYQGEGVFIAGGAGVTPFISIFRFLHAKNEIGNNKLIFTNKTKADIILEPEFTKLLGSNFINILSREKAEGYRHGHISTEILQEANVTRGTNIYLCGPDAMIEFVEKLLMNLSIDANSIVKEKF